jgi:hypothetical protein
MHDPLQIGPVERFSMTAEEQRALIERTQRELPIMVAKFERLMARRRLRRIEQRRRMGLPPLEGDVTSPTRPL